MPSRSRRSGPCRHAAGLCQTPSQRCSAAQRAAHSSARRVSAARASGGYLRFFVRVVFFVFENYEAGCELSARHRI